MAADVRSLNMALKRYDRSLFCRQESDGIIRVYQRPDKGGEWLVCSLTDTWGSSGQKREWGVLPVIEHIKRGSLEYRDRMNSELDRERAVLEEAKDRKQKTLFEDMAHETHASFKEAFKDIRTCNMDKKNDVRRKYDNKI